MTQLTKNLVSRVTTRKEAEQVVTELLRTFSSTTAQKKLSTEAYESKQSESEVLRRRVANVFSVFSTSRKTTNS